MRALVQRVTRGRVVVDDAVVGEIGRGFVVLVGITHEDGEAEADWIANKLVGLRLFEDDDGKMNASLTDVGGALLLVSQFTLYGDARKGRRPSFSQAARPSHAEPLFEYFVTQCRAHGVEVQTGVFGAMMQVDIHNDGPVTLMLER